MARLKDKDLADIVCHECREKSLEAEHRWSNFFVGTAISMPIFGVFGPVIFWTFRLVRSTFAIIAIMGWKMMS